ncbi:serine/threonine-protein kinase [Leptothoe kymatousa]|uniref:non-specific serine/threonine protein kinase n=1 Tax=Leptothoe kymatousa TAU-MAC 1615 TaxID=2364775 RepID=A0ABS5XZ59_9CYAN|nr:serine/threonine-protein kinase [Leptothoe kymatousa]MBT9310893.1 protein kinase [Leptothoe kymatousa TAU-MAC 1615]
MSKIIMNKPEIQGGTLIDNRYLIDKVLGQGGLGRTYLAVDTRRFNEPCVLKEFAPSGTGQHSLQKSRSLFKREAEILYHIEHNQIPNFLACFEGDGRLFLVQEYVNGRTYSDLLKERRDQGLAFDEAEIIDWLHKLLPVLNYIHERGVIHRDISPDNIMLPENGNLPVLIDFGVGKQIVENSNLNERDINEVSYVGKMSLVGKVGYAPHEQIRLGICSASSDLYALGVTAIVLLTCKDPSMLMNQYTLQWEWPNHVDLSPQFSQILDKLLADTPASRYQSTAEVLDDLQALTQDFDSELQPEETLLSLSYDEVMASQTLISSPPPGLATPTQDASSFNNVAPVAVPAPKQIAQPPSALANNVTPAFIDRCKEKLADYIGPMAQFVIDEVLDVHAPASIHQLVDLLLQEIPSPQEAEEFRRHLL